VGDVRTIGRAALRVVEVVDDDADGEAKAPIKRAHPLRVAASEVVVDGDNVDATSCERIQDGGKGGDERFAFARFHFRNFSVVENESADELDVEMAHVEETAAGFTREGECRDDGRLESGLK